MKTLGNIGVVVGMVLAVVIVGSIVATVLFVIWIIAICICLLKMKKPPTIKEFLNL